jgi:hypothetical protein
MYLILQRRIQIIALIFHSATTYFSTMTVGKREKFEKSKQKNSQLVMSFE